MSDDKTASGDEMWADDLLGELRVAGARCDPVPPDAVAAARSALAWRTMDAELAELVADSSVDMGMAVVRSADTPTLLTFESSALTVEVEVVTRAGARRLTGQVVPPGPGVVEVRHRGGAVTVPVDEVGRFSADGIAAGPVSLRVSSGARLVETDWFLG